MEGIVDRRTMLVLAFAIAGSIITCAFVAAFCYNLGWGWAIAALISSGYTLGHLRVEMQNSRYETDNTTPTGE
jgi:hypothetical protein